MLQEILICWCLNLMKMVKVIMSVCLEVVFNMSKYAVGMLSALKSVAILLKLLWNHTLIHWKSLMPFK